MNLDLKKTFIIVFLLNNVFIKTMYDSNIHSEIEKIDHNKNNTISQTIKDIISNSDSTVCTVSRNAKIKNAMLNFLENENAQTCLKNLTELQNYFQELLCLAILDKYEHLFLLSSPSSSNSFEITKLNLRQLILITKLILNPKETSALLKIQDCLEIFDSLEDHIRFILVT